MSIVRNEGVGALFRGALPRALWVAPVGAMNFAGYELAKRALAGPDAAATANGGGNSGASSGGAGQHGSGTARQNSQVEQQGELVAAGS